MHKRCSFPECKRLIFDDNKMDLCHKHIEDARFIMWFLTKLQNEPKNDERTELWIPGKNL